MRSPQLDPVRLCRLKGFQIVAGVLRALAAKVHALFSGAFRHGADAQAEIASLFRTASMTFQFLDRAPRTTRARFQPVRVFPGPDIYRAGRAEESANGGKFFVNGNGHRLPFVLLDLLVTFGALCGTMYL
jgi:hypothetical protein